MINIIVTKSYCLILIDLLKPIFFVVHSVYDICKYFRVKSRIRILDRLPILNWIHGFHLNRAKIIVNKNQIIIRILKSDSTISTPKGTYALKHYATLFYKMVQDMVHIHKFFLGTPQKMVLVSYATSFKNLVYIPLNFSDL